MIEVGIYNRQTTQTKQEKKAIFVIVNDDYYTNIFDDDESMGVYSDLARSFARLDCQSILFSIPSNCCFRCNRAFSRDSARSIDQSCSDCFIDDDDDCSLSTRFADRSPFDFISSKTSNNFKCSICLIMDQPRKCPTPKPMTAANESINAKLSLLFNTVFGLWKYARIRPVFAFIKGISYLN
ncbi:hypothetical protein DERF_004351 [Dermatophagoides farinae]|uniref:Uncharacterized protein n=1 Tax=Dermatophagoides farinae TaxID=6954 RepID=A0A922I1S0_DERFA|nr:hypothetical protein DERF_004351 [Dermatophagoides farinae]